jgi:hypothetical protein
MDVLRSIIILSYLLDLLGARIYFPTHDLDSLLFTLPSPTGVFYRTSDATVLAKPGPDGTDC